MTAKNGAFGKPNPAPGANPTVVSVGGAGGQSTGIGQYGSNSVGAGLSPLTPLGVKTTTGGFNEAQDYLKSIGGGVIEVTHSITGMGQFVFRNGVSVRGNNYQMTNSATNPNMPTPFITDPDIAMANKSDLLGLNLNVDGIARTDTIVNAPGATTIGASPYTYANATPGYTLIAVLDGTVSAITNGGNACPNVYGIFAVAPGKSLVVTYTAGAGTTPTVVLLAAGAVLGPGSTNNWDMTLTGTNGGNGVLGCGWVSPAGTDLGNNFGNHYWTLGVLSTTGLFAYRFMGAGGGNNDAFVNNDIDFIYAQGFAAGGVNPGYGIIFSYHTDSNRIAMAYLVPNAAAAAGSYTVAFNDGYFAASPATDVKVNGNIIGWLIATPNTAGTNCNLALVNASGLTASSGGANEITRFERLASLITPVLIQNGGLFTGHDSTVGHLAWWNLSKTNILGVMPSVSFKPANLTGVVLAATFQMGGLGAGTGPVLFTPNLTGIIKVTLVAQMETSVAADGYKVQLYVGTGTAPVQGAAVTGTAIMNNAVARTVTVGASDYDPVTLVGYVTGLTVGTQYWGDIAIAWVTTGGTFIAQNVFVIVEELPA